ncbi:MAG TPA: SLC13 family permease [Pyrinomonadaceae bacterium]|nr:SLC13 family permease [Pyrinomonadaceae bacterium]
MTPQIAIVLGLLFVALVLFSTERIPIEVVSLLLVMALVLTNTLTAGEAFAGFGNDIVITIAGLFILTGGLARTGVIDLVGRRLHRTAGDSEFRMVALIMLAAAFCAAVMKNTTTTAMFLPVVLGIAARRNMSPSKLLMPLAFGAILGGTCTLIGTSTNLAVSGALPRYGIQPFTMFELTRVGVVIVGVGLLYMLFVGRRLLPNRKSNESLTEQYHVRQYMTEVIVLDDSPLIGKSLAEARIGDELDLTVLGILRGEAQDRIAPNPAEQIRADDLLLVQGRVEDILKVKAEAGIEIKPDFKLNDSFLETKDTELFEAMIPRGSDFMSRTLKRLDLRNRYGVVVLAIDRHGVDLLSKISRVRLRFGDVLLIQGNREQVERLAADGQVLLLEEISEKRARPEKRKWALLAFGIFLFFSLTHLVPLPIAVLLGVMILLASQSLRMSEAYEIIDWRLLILIACMMSFGVAMEKTGADQYLANLIVRGTGQYGPTAVLAGFFLMTVALTQPMSNQAAALVMLPIAVKTAVALGLNPRTFAVTVTYAASCSFLTPLEPACVLVYTPGHYRFLDFVKVGSLLTIAVFAIVVWLVPLFWPFR